MRAVYRTFTLLFHNSSPWTCISCKNKRTNGNVSAMMQVRQSPAAEAVSTVPPGEGGWLFVSVHCRWLLFEATAQFSTMTWIASWRT